MQRLNLSYLLFPISRKMEIFGKSIDIFWKLYYKISTETTIKFPSLPIVLLYLQSTLPHYLLCSQKSFHLWNHPKVEAFFYQNHIFYTLYMSVFAIFHLALSQCSSIIQTKHIAFSDLKHISCMYFLNSFFQLFFQDFKCLLSSTMSCQIETWQFL